MHEPLRSRARKGFAVLRLLVGISGCVVSLFAHGRALAQPSRVGPEAGEDGELRFNYSGYLRAPMRVGLGAKDEVRAEGDEARTTFHVPVIPDDQYINWQHTRHNERDWAEMFFSVGNASVAATVGVSAFNFTDSAWKESDAQFGIALGWVTLTPELPWEGVELSAKLGSHWNRYGMAGRYDAGEYDTYLFGRTHALGETARLYFELGDVGFFVEEGIGVKRPNPAVTNRARFTVLAHGHAGVSFGESLSLGAHYLTSWAREESRDLGPDAPPAGTIVFNSPVPDGRLSVWGGELEWQAGPFGRLYAGFSQILARHAFTVAPAIEVLHAFGGGEFHLGVVDQYLEAPLSPRGDVTGIQDCHNDDVWNTPGCSRGNGTVNTLAWQYEASLRDVIDAVSGSSSLMGSTDLRTKLYGMINFVASDTTLVPSYSSYARLKFGADFELRPWQALGFGLRADRVQPHDEIPEQSFSVVSPRIVLRTALASQETVTLQYSRYLYAARECPAGSPLLCVQSPPAGTAPEGFGSAPGVNQDADTRGAPVTSTGTQRPDLNVVKLEVSMWW